MILLIVLYYTLLCSLYVTCSMCFIGYVVYIRFRSLIKSRLYNKRIVLVNYLN